MPTACCHMKVANPAQSWSGDRLQGQPRIPSSASARKLTGCFSQFLPFGPSLPTESHPGFLVTEHGAVLGNFP